MTTEDVKPKRRIAGFSMLDALLIVAAVIGIILVILPSMARSRARSSKVSCTNNLKQLGLSFRLWGLDNEDKFPMQVSATNGGAMEQAQLGSAYAVFLVMSNELSTPKILICPEESNPKRVAANAFALSVPPGSRSGLLPFTPTNNLSYFVGLDADEVKPETIISGDDNFTVGKVRPIPGLLLLDTNSPVTWTKGRHEYGGNIGLADGSVQSFSTPAFRAALIKTGIATNRLAMP
ncbi:MAG: type II secretion system protein [Verrucomicrobia bacterium]|nr:type II secretion system protein [Verrucomicrobiota bacterium]